MIFSTKYYYRFVLMTADAHLIDSLIGSFSTKERALVWARKAAVQRRKKLGIVYVTNLATNECEIYTASGHNWVLQRIKAMENKKENTAAISIGNRLQAIRIEKGLSVDDICMRADIKPSTLAAIEKGKYNSGIREIAKISQALGAHVEIVED